MLVEKKTDLMITAATKEAGALTKLASTWVAGVHTVHAHLSALHVHLSALHAHLSALHVHLSALHAHLSALHAFRARIDPCVVCVWYRWGDKASEEPILGFREENIDQSIAQAAAGAGKGGTNKAEMDAMASLPTALASGASLLMQWSSSEEGVEGMERRRETCEQEARGQRLTLRVHACSHSHAFSYLHAYHALLHSSIHAHCVWCRWRWPSSGEHTRGEGRLPTRRSSCSGIGER